ncbi:MAG: hypothetical protein ABSF44_12100 [Candidatus Bathyarchaeia archaeon]|jgi:hypothetical protein
MIRLLKNRYALATVITTLIILVVAVLLAGVVCYFAINVVSTRVQQESLKVSNVHAWVDGAGTAEAALMITNIGGRDVVVSQIQVRGQSSAFSTGGNVYYAVKGTGDTIPSTLSPIAFTTPANIVGAIPFPAPSTTALALSGVDLVLSSGGTMIVYITSPDSVTINDVGLTIGLTVFSAQAMYYQETNIQATTVTL